MVIVKVILVCCRKFSNMNSKSTIEEEPLLILYFLPKIFINKPKIILLILHLLIYYDHILILLIYLKSAI